MSASVLLLRVPSTGDRVGAIDPPISQGLVAASLHAHEIEAEVLDLTWAGEAGIEQLIASFDNDELLVVGMSAYQTNIERCIRIAQLIRSARPDIRILLGGPQATHMPAEGLVAMPEVDGLCRGPAELVLPAYIKALKDKKINCTGFLHRDRDDKIIDGGRPPPPGPCDLRTPFDPPMWPLNRYPFAVTFSSRGCPYDCAFCYTPASSSRRMIYAELEPLLHDVAVMASAGLRHLFFADPIFVVDRTRTLRLLNALANCRTEMSFSCELRFEHVDDELLKAMYCAGFVKVAFGLESANEQVLAGIRKPTDLEQFREVVLGTLASGIAVEVFYMYGLPGESFRDVVRTFDFVSSLHKLVDELSEPQQVQLYFGTELLRNSGAYGIQILSQGPAYLSPGKNFRTDCLGPDEFRALEEEWRGRRLSVPSPTKASPASLCPIR